jgi:hypothetical protein
MRGAEIVTVSGEEVPLLSMPRLAVVRGRLTGLWAEAGVNFSWTISPAKLDREQAMAIIIADEDVKWLLPKRDCIEAMRVASGILMEQRSGAYPTLSGIADPERKYLAKNVGAVSSCIARGAGGLRPHQSGRLQISHRAADHWRRSAQLGLQRRWPGT